MYKYLIIILAIALIGCNKTNDKESDTMNSAQDEVVLGEEVSTESGLKYIDNVILKYLKCKMRRC